MSELQTTVPVRLYPTPDQAAMLRAHCQEYSRPVNVLVQALDSDVLPADASTKDFTAALPSAVKNQCRRAARSVWKRSVELGGIPVLRKPICQWNNQNWRIAGDPLIIPVCQDGKVGQIAMPCSGTEPLGKPGILRIKHQRGKWVADVSSTLASPDPAPGERFMGIDRGVKVPAVVQITGTGHRCFGNGRYQRAMRRRFSARRNDLHTAKKVRAVRTSAGQERRWMRDINHQLSQQIVSHAQAQGGGTIRMEQLAGIRPRTARTSRGAKGCKVAKARKNNRMMATWTLHPLASFPLASFPLASFPLASFPLASFPLASFIAYKAERASIRVEWMDPAHTSQLCPACFHLNGADDRRYVCAQCGWRGHRDAVGAITISRGTGPRGHSAGATVA